MSAVEDAIPQGLLDELRRVARAKMSRLPPGQTLQATALVHEAYLRIALEDRPERSEEQVLICAARAMQDVLVEIARRKASLRAGGAWRRASLEDVSAPTQATPEELLSLADALDRLERLEPCKAELVRLRFFAGLSEAECARLLHRSVRTLRRDWSFARAWLLTALEDGEAEAGT